MRFGRAKVWAASGALLLGGLGPWASTAAAQRDHGRNDRYSNNGNDRYDNNYNGHNNYYGGMRGNVDNGNYDQRYRQDDRDHHHSGGGIGPGYGALIGGGGGAALGALFGGGMKGTLIGGAAGAGLGALGGKLAQGSGNDHHDYHHR